MLYLWDLLSWNINISKALNLWPMIETSFEETWKGSLILFQFLYDWIFFYWVHIFDKKEVTDSTLEINTVINPFLSLNNTFETSCKTYIFEDDRLFDRIKSTNKISLSKIWVLFVLDSSFKWDRHRLYFIDGYICIVKICRLVR